MSNRNSGSKHWQGPHGGGNRGRTGNPSTRQTTSQRPVASGNLEAHRSTPEGNQGRPGGTIFMQDRPGRVDARMQDSSDLAVVANLNKEKSSSGDNPDESDRLPVRPDFGVRGKEIALRTNYFPVDIQSGGKIYRYKAEIALIGDKKLSRRAKHRVFELAEQTDEWKQANLPGRVAHDNAERLVACFLLPQPQAISGTLYYEEEGDPLAKGETKYTLTLTFEEEVDRQILNECLAGTPVDSQALSKVLSALNLVLTAHPSQTGIKIGREDEKKKNPDQRIFFDSPDPKDIGGGLAVREGFYVSVRPAHQQLMVNVNTCHAAFYKPQNFADALDENNRITRSGSGAFGHQVRVKTRYNNLVVMIQGMSNKYARQHKIKHDQFGLVTIEKYYELKHNIKLKCPELPLLKDSKGNLYPPELCDILPHQGFKGELSDSRHATKMLNEACKPPKENANEIVNRGTDVLGFRDSNPVLDSFGISVGKEMAVVPSRILDKPKLSYSSAAPLTVNDRASWNLRDVKFAVGARLSKWAVLVIKDGGKSDFTGTDDQELRKVVVGFRAMCNKSGMQVEMLAKHAYAVVQLPRRGADRFRDDAIKAMEQGLGDLIGRATPELILVMLSNDDSTIYDGLKWLCDVKLDIATICMQSAKVRKPQGQPQYFANVALKVNMKLGGINHTLDANSGTWLKSSSTMIMGMDVTHPTGGPKKGAPSVAAVVASVDKHFAQYPVILRLRTGGEEINRDQDSGDNVLRDMFISRFELYKNHNKGALPERVILYRDGVSESQFVQVRKYELTEMKRAFENFGKYRPKLSIIVCGKRHHTRFYPTMRADAALDGNPLPGTVVDRGVTPAYEFDFFLQAHGSLKGTARPTHYYVVHDENGFTADDLQRVTNDLSYLFARATKAVSLVSPAYWADVACERGRCYLHKVLQGSRDDGDAAAKDKKGKKRVEDTMFEKAQKMWGTGVSGPRLRDTMFYL